MGPTFRTFEKSSWAQWTPVATISEQPPDPDPTRDRVPRLDRLVPRAGPVAFFAAAAANPAVRGYREERGRGFGEWNLRR